MPNLEDYIHAATRDNTRRSYQSAIKHFEVTWGGFLPATADNIVHYLSDHADTLAVSTLKQRISAIAQWHIEQGFPDPTKTSIVSKVLKGIRELHPQKVKQAKPIQIEELAKVIAFLDKAHEEKAISTLRYYRDKSLVLMGFWRGFRSEELCRLSAEFIDVNPNGGLNIFLPRSKGDRGSNGRNYFVPSLMQMCPTRAYEDWLDASKIKKGPVYRSINRWGKMSCSALHPNSINPLLRSLFVKSGISDEDRYSSHSFRRGFASWATQNQWDLSSLMQYVGWSDPKSALRYIETNNFESHFNSIPFSRELANF